LENLTPWKVHPQFQAATKKGEFRFSIIDQENPDSRLTNSSAGVPDLEVPDGKLLVSNPDTISSTNEEQIAHETTRAVLPELRQANVNKICIWVVKYDSHEDTLMVSGGILAHVDFHVDEGCSLTDCRLRKRLAQAL